MHVSPADAPRDLVAIPADIPDDVPVTRLRPRDLPAGWRSHPAPEALADLGSDWAASGRTAVLMVPSPLIPQEENYLLSPEHADFRRLRVGRASAFRFDARMWKGAPGPQA